MRYGVFILPKGDLLEKVLRWKSRLDKNYGNSPYLSHPPHLTLFHFITNDNYVVNIFKNISLNSIKPFTINISTTLVFWDDIYTGGNTVCFSVEKNDNLFKIQHLIAEHLKSQISIVKNKNHLSSQNNLQSESYRKYGFPFVGNHWIPHFSIASLFAKKDDSIYTDFQNTSVNITNLVDRISLWGIIGDDHTKKAELML